MFLHRDPVGGLLRVHCWLGSNMMGPHARTIRHARQHRHHLVKVGVKVDIFVREEGGHPTNIGTVRCTVSMVTIVVVSAGGRHLSCDKVFISLIQH